MNRQITLIFLALLLTVSTQAQKRISREYNNVSISDALNGLAEQQTDYAIMFLYNELEDFRITTTVNRKTLPDAILQMIGFYPIRMTVDTSNPDEKKIFVECTHKTNRHLTGTIINEQGLPLAYANIAILNPADSTLLGGGVSNESGYFAIPYEQDKVLARISYIGYKTIYKICDRPEVGTIRLQQDNYTLNGVIVKGYKPTMKMTNGGLEVAIENTILAKMGTASDVLGQLPRVSVNNDAITVFGKGAPIIYINNKRMTNSQELRELKSEDIKSIEVITNPGAEYDAEVEAVIRIKTKHRQVSGFSIRNDAYGSYNKWMSGFDQLTMKYQTKKFEIINSTYVNADKSGEDNQLDINLLTDENQIHISQKIPVEMSNTALSEYFATDYYVNDSNSVGASYQYYGSLHGRSKGSSHQTILRNGQPEGVVDMTEVFENDHQQHTANIYYVGKLGRLGIDFNGSYFNYRSGRDDEAVEISQELGNRNVHSDSRQHSQVYAAKLMFDYPLLGGKLSFGTEISKTKSHGLFRNLEQYVPSSETDIHERNLSGFAQYALSLKHWSIGVGVRYENVVRDYFSEGVRQDDASRRYNNVFPNLSLSWQRGEWSLQLNANEKMHRPSYRSLRNYMQYDNRYLYEGGNPSLLPERVYSTEASLIYKWVYASLGHKYVKDAMVWTKSLLDQQEIAFTTNRNFDHQQMLYASISLSPRFGKYQPMVEVNYQQQFFDTQGYGSRESLSKPGFGFRFNNRYTFNESLMATLSLQGATRQYSGFRMKREGFSVDLTLRKSFAKDTWTVYLMASDIFKTWRERWTMYGQGAESTKDCYNYTRSISLQVTYNFNAKRSKYKGTGAGNDEKNRL
ncbi:MAG: TonB-dependent receptor [Prevotella sp.]|nr:TonB-dependent receptor [Prevotella sp.]